jgi:large subunit ribosomal protein L4
MAADNPAPVPAKPARRSRGGSVEPKPPKAPLLDAAGKKAKDVSLEESVFGAEIKPHLVHETVRAELNADRAGTRGAKTRGLVAGGRSKPWRQKGTGRARAGTIRAPQFTGGGVAFALGMRSFEVKVNKKARHAALRSALSDHAAHGTIAVLGTDAFTEPSTKQATGLLSAWAQDLPLLVIARSDEEPLIKSFRNLEKTVVTVPSELEVSQVVWARSVLVSEGALGDVQGRAA